MIALIPAAGVGSRLPGTASSKEMLPAQVGGDAGDEMTHTEPVICHLLRSLRRAGVSETRIVLRNGKWDIPDYLSDPAWDDVNARYVITRGTSGVPETTALGLRDRPETDIVFGFPDILFEPVSAIGDLVNRLRSSRADLVLGLFPTENPAKMDMVRTDADGRVSAIDIKPAQTSLEFAWIMAAWKPSFTRYFLDVQRDMPDRIRQQASQHGDLHLGHTFQLAMQDGLAIEAEIFANGRSLDIGTPDDLDKAANWFMRDKEHSRI